MDDKKSGNNIVSMMEEWFKKAPVLPPNAIETLTKFAPILALVFGVLGIIGALAGFGLMTAFLPVAVVGKVGTYGMVYFAAIAWAISSVLMLMAYPGLKARKMSGWNLLFWSVVVNVVASLLSFSLGAVVGAVIGFYLLFQIKASYK